MLQLESISKSYSRGPSAIEVLKRVSLTVSAREMVAVYGARGTGKTTLLRIAAGLEAPDSGRTTVAGQDLSRLSRGGFAELRREQVCWVERAGPHSRELTAGAWVALTLYRKLGRREAERRAASALARVGAADCADRTWDDISDAGRSLVAIAHALVREPGLLVVDDPTARLGIIDRERVAGLLRSAAEDGGLAVLMAVPDLPATLQAHRIHLLSRGRLLAPDPPPPQGATVVQLHGQGRPA